MVGYSATLRVFCDTEVAPNRVGLAAEAIRPLTFGMGVAESCGAGTAAWGGGTGQIRCRPESYQRLSWAGGTLGQVAFLSNGYWGMVMCPSWTLPGSRA